jgi:hypothetical protein
MEAFPGTLDAESRGSTLLLSRTGDGPGAAVDAVGRIVVAGPSWLTDGDLRGVGF